MANEGTARAVPAVTPISTKRRKVSTRGTAERRWAGSGPALGTACLAARRKFPCSVVLQRRTEAFLPVQCDARLLEVEIALEPAPRFVGDLSLLQQPVNVVALGGDQFDPDVGCRRGRIAVSPVLGGLHHRYCRI
jgi:hypothetical protein